MGFVRDKSAWLDRYRSGELETAALSWDDVSVTDHGDVAVTFWADPFHAAFPSVGGWAEHVG